jgi:hypothetical protein
VFTPCFPDESTENALCERNRQQDQAIHNSVFRRYGRYLEPITTEVGEFVWWPTVRVNQERFLNVEQDRKREQESK